MPQRRHPPRENEPEVTFELDEASRSPAKNRIGASSVAAVAGAGLVSSAAAADLDDSIDVFDQLEAPDEPSGATPVTSFQELTDASADSEFPPIDFGTVETKPDEAGNEANTDDTFGATASVGGGFTLESVGDQEAFGASTDPIEEPEEPLLLYDDPDSEQASEAEDPDDLDSM